MEPTRDHPVAEEGDDVTTGVEVEVSQETSSEGCDGVTPEVDDAIVPVQVVGEEATSEEGRDDAKSEEKTALERFPDEIWRKILTLLQDPKDFINVSRTCWDLNGIVEKYRLEWVPPIRMVMPFVARFLSKQDLLTLRQVSRRLSRYVEKFLEDNPFRRFSSDPNSDPQKEQSILTLLTAERYYDSVKMEEFMEELEDHYYDHDRNPFVGPALHLELGTGTWNYAVHFRFIRNVMDFVLPCQPVQRFIRHVKISYGDCFRDAWELYYLLNKLFGSLRNIRSLYLQLGDCHLFSCERKKFLRNARNNPLPGLAHSGPISVKLVHEDVYALAILDVVIGNSYHAQLLGLELDLELLEDFLPTYNCPHLTRLTLSNVSIEGCRECLPRIEAPNLERLTLDWRKRWDEELDGPESEADFDGKANIKDLGENLRRFPNLRVLKLLGLGATIFMSSCIWHRKLDQCMEVVVLSQEEVFTGDGTGNHDRLQHEGMIWRLLPSTVEELYINSEEKFLRQSSRTGDERN